MSKGLPALWRMAPVGACLERQRESVNPAAFPNDSFHFVGLEHIDGGGLGGVAIQEVSGDEIRSQKTLFREGDLLYGKLRPYLNKVTVAPRDGICSTDIWAFRPRSVIDAEFAFYALSSSNFNRRVGQITRGANLPRAEADPFDAIQIALPPLSEQRQIVEVLREAESIRHLRAEADRKTSELIPALFHEMFGDPVSSENHQMRALGLLLEEIDSGWSPSASNIPAAENEWGVLKLGAITWGEYVETENKALLAETKPRPELEVKGGDILLEMSPIFDHPIAMQFPFRKRASASSDRLAWMPQA